MRPGAEQPLGLGEVVAAGADDGAGVGRAQGAAVVVVELRAAGPVGLGEVQEGEVAAAELAGDVQPGVGALGVLGAVERADRGDPDGDAVGGPGVDDGVGDLEHQPGAVGQRAAVLVGALVAVGGEELVQQVAVGAVDLDEVEAGLAGVDGRAAEVLEQPRDLVEPERPRGRAADPGRAAVLAAHGGAVAVGPVARRHRQVAVVEGLVRDPADVPQLGGDQAAGLVHGVGDPAPAGDLLVAVDAGGVHVALALGADLGALGDQQAGARALHVVLAHQVVGHVARHGGAHPGQRGHQDAVVGADGAEGQGLEEGGHDSRQPAPVRPAIPTPGPTVTRRHARAAPRSPATTAALVHPCGYRGGR